MQVPPFSLEKQLSEIGQDIDLATLRVVQSGHYIGGSEVNAFEQSFVLEYFLSLTDFLHSIFIASFKSAEK